jgi:hypothetical protein
MGGFAALKKRQNLRFFWGLEGWGALRTAPRGLRPGKASRRKRKTRDQQ